MTCDVATVGHMDAILKDAGIEPSMEAKVLILLFAAKRRLEVVPANESDGNRTARLWIVQDKITEALRLLLEATGGYKKIMAAIKGLAEV